MPGARPRAGRRSWQFPPERRWRPASRNSTASSGVTMPPMPMTGMIDRLGCLVDHAQGDGLDGRPGEAAGDIAEARLAGFRVDGHGEESIGEADGGGAGVLRDLGHVGDGGDVGRELDDQRPARRGAGAVTRYSSVPGSAPKAMPPAWTLGQETLSSYAAMPSAWLSRSMTATYSATV